MPERVFMNTCMFSGNMTRDVEVRTTPNGTTVGNFGLAVNRKYKSGDELKEETAWLDCEVWGKQAEILSKYGGKGKKLLIEKSRVKTDQWETEEGQKRSKQIFVVENFEFIGAKLDKTEENSSGDESNTPNVPF